MATLSPELAAARRRLDYRTMIGIKSSLLVTMTAFGAGASKPISTADGDQGKASAYVVEYALPFLTGPGTTADVARVRFDIGATSNYPFTEPVVTVVSTPRPWSPHVHPMTGSVCLGEMWSCAKGRMLLAHLVTHVAKLLNCDEPDRGPEYFGWNPAAAKYWRTVMGARPLTPGLAYPTPPTDLTHPTPAPTSGGGIRVAALSPSIRRVVSGLRTSAPSGDDR